MIPQFEKFNPRERELLLHAPVLLSVLASCSPNSINQKQKADAVKLAHIKTFTAIPELQPYYKEAEKDFVSHFEKTADRYFPFDELHLNMLKSEIKNVREIIAKLNHAYGEALTKSLERYAIHVKRSTYSIFRDFIFPLAMMDLKDSQSPII